MCRDVWKHCCSCLACGTRKGTGRASHPPLKLTPVSGPFSGVGVDILKLPQPYDGNQYVVVFVDYLTKWVEAFPAAHHYVRERINPALPKFLPTPLLLNVGVVHHRPLR